MRVRPLLATCGLAAACLAVQASAAVITGGTATQSSGYQGDQFPASNAIDGNFDNFSHTSSDDRAATLTYDLPGTTDYTIDQVTLFNRTNCCGERLRDITISVLAQDGTTVNFTSPLLNPGNNLGFSGTTPSGSTPDSEDIVYSLPAGVQGGFVRISRTADGSPPGNDDTNVLALGELQVSGTLVPEPATFGLLGVGGIGLLARRRRTA